MVLRNEEAKARWAGLDALTPKDRIVELRGSIMWHAWQVPPLTTARPWPRRFAELGRSASEVTA